jgi:hypothetical protein
MSERATIALPPGRLISGSMTEINKTDYQGRDLPENKWNRYIGVAISKVDQPGVPTGLFNGVPTAGITDLLTKIWQFGCAAVAQQPHVLAHAQKFLSDPNANFAWKISDGDKPNKKGKLNPNAAGCWVFNFQTTLPIAACDNLNKTIDPALVKRGFYVDVAASLSWNKLTDDNAGIYLNPDIVRLLGYGPEIFGGPDADTAFAGQAAVLPPGASALPVAGVGAGAPGLPGVGGASAGGLPGVGATGGGQTLPTASHGSLPGVGGGLPGVGMAGAQPFHQAGVAPGGGGLPPGIG